MLKPLELKGFGIKQSREKLIIGRSHTRSYRKAEVFKLKSEYLTLCVAANIEFSMVVKLNILFGAG